MRRSIILLVPLFLALLGAVAATPLLEQAPALRTDTALGQFDAVRAKATLALILGEQRPHPADSDGDDAVRARLVGTLRQMGFNPAERDQFACNELYKERGVSCARVRNVIAVLGPSTGRSLLLNAHYDSTPVGPGAADDGIGVATLLEVARSLKDRPLKRPVVLLFNEGEELGLVGARAFLADPLSRNVDSLVNLEARGVRGPVNMFETSRPNAAPIALFAAAVNRPVANSLSTDVYRLMPNYTDVNTFSERGWVTLNLAPIGNETRYHSPGDDVAALDLATLQHMGDQTLALATALADGSPSPSAGNRIFMDVTGRWLITMPLSVGVTLVALLALTLAAAALKRGMAWRGTAIALATIVGSGALAWILFAGEAAVKPGMFWRAHPIWIHLQAYGCALIAGTELLAWLGHRVSTAQLRASFWLVFLAIGAVIGLFAPGGIVFFLIPPILVVIGIIASRWWRPAEPTFAALAILFLYLTWGAMLGLLGELLNAGPMWVFAPLSALLLLPVLIEAKPLIDTTEPRAATGIATIITIACWAASAVSPAYSADRQQRFVIQHVSDARAGKAWWSILNDRAPLPAAFGDGWKRGKLPVGETMRWLKPAPADPATKPPSIQLISQVRNGNERTLSLRMLANGAQEVGLVAPEDAKIRSAGTRGFVRPIDQQEDGKYYLGCSGRSCDGALFELTTDEPKPIEFLVIGSRRTLPPSARALIGARPEYARPQYSPDASIAFAHVSL